MSAPTTTPPVVAKAPAPAPERQGISQLPGLESVPGVRTPAADLIITRGGKLQRVTGQVVLRMSEGHIYTIDDGETFMVQAEGFFAVNRIAGLQFVQPPTVPVEGVDRPNPYVIRGAGGRIEGMYIRGALVGRDMTGAMRIVMETLYLDPNTWFQLGLIKGAKFNDKAGQWGDAVRLVATDKVLPAEEREDHYAVYPLDETVSAVVDLRSYQARKLLETKSAVQRDFTKRALTVLQRRLFRAHPGAPGQRLARGTVKVTMGERKVWKDGGYVMEPCIVEAVATVPVLGWVDDSPVTEKLADAIRRNQSTIQDAMVDDLGSADLNDEQQDEERVQAEVEVTPAKPATGSAAPGPATATEAHITAKAALAALKKSRGGAGLAREIVEKFLGDQRTIDDLPETEAQAMLGEIETAAASLAPKGGAS